ncbi:MAG: hypothetical protein ACK5YS_00715 [bacterium]
MKAEFQVTYFLWIARKDKSGLAPVYIRSKQNSDKQIAYNTGVKLHKEQWKEGKNRPKSMPDKLTELEGKLQATYKDLVAQGHEPDLKALLFHLNDSRKPTDKNIVAWCDDYLKAPYSAGQKKSVATLKTNLAGDAKKKKAGFNPSLTFDKLTKPRIKSFFEWLTAQGVANNSQYKRLRALINVAEHANLDIAELKNYEMPYSTANALKPRLTWQEVKKVMDTEAKTELEQVAKEVFLLACFSGLRIDDILTLNQGELHKFYYERTQNKTKLPVLVTIHRHNERLFKKFISGVGYTRQTLSTALKPLLKRSGLTKKVTRVQAVGFAFTDVVRAKYEEIAFHSGRRFYARLLNDLGCGGEIARDELGHSYKSITDLYAGSQEHNYRVARVRKAIESIEETYEELALMKVA